jgi:uncharacterized delta-60 repeat protein
MKGPTMRRSWHQGLSLLLLLPAAGALGALAVAGDLDPGFGTAGVVLRDPLNNGLGGEGRAVAVQKDGKILVAGNPVFSMGGGSGARLGVWRFEPDGDPDPTFGQSGFAFLQLGDDGSLAAMAVQRDGKIVIAGQARVGVVDQFVVARFTEGGQLDASFQGGHVIFGFGPGQTAAARAVAVQKDGKIVLAGYAQGADGRNFGLARLTAAGLLDTSFDFDGRVTTDFGLEDLDDAQGVAIQSDGKIVAVGRTAESGAALAGDARVLGGPAPFDFAVARYLKDGRLDPSFGGDGRVTTNFGEEDVATGVAIQRDGRIVVAGSSGLLDFAVARYLNSSRLDRSFDGDGKVTTDFGGGDVATALTLQRDGKIVVVGAAFNGVNEDLALARYRTNGSVDRSFGRGDLPPRGQVENDLGGREIARAVALQRDGKIVVAGSAPLTDTLVVARYLGR